MVGVDEPHGRESKLLSEPWEDGSLVLPELRHQGFLWCAVWSLPWADVALCPPSLNSPGPPQGFEQVKRCQSKDVSCLERESISDSTPCKHIPGAQGPFLSYDYRIVTHKTGRFICLIDSVIIKKKYKNETHSSIVRFSEFFFSRAPFWVRYVWVQIQEDFQMIKGASLLNE